MQSLEQLLEQFPDTPQHIVIKADVLRRGVRRNGDLQEAGARSNTTGLSSKLEQALGAGDPPPSQFHFVADETTVDIKVDDTSPYEIRKRADGGYGLFGGEDLLAPVRFTPRPAYMDLETSAGTPCADFLLHRGPSCVCVSPLNFCAYLKRGDACRYCLCSPAMDAGIQMKLLDPVPDYGVLAEAVEVACRQDVDLKELKLTGGALYDVRKEAAHYRQCLEAILGRIPAPEEITLLSQAFEPEDQRELRDLGVTNVCFDLEIMDERLWHELVPGKARAVGHAEWLKRLDTAVEIFGRGHVGTNFVGGFECAPRPGFLSQEEAFRVYVDGFRGLIERGVVPWFTIWTAHPLVGDFQGDDPPGTAFYLRLGQALHELLERAGVYPDLGFGAMGQDPRTLGLYCYYCYSMQFTRDYPRLLGRAG